MREIDHILRQMPRTLMDMMKDIKVQALDEFDKNFERQSFFDRRWPDRKKETTKTAGRALLVKTGRLRRSIRGHINGTTLSISSDVPYAEVHNRGYIGGQSVRAHRRRQFGKAEAFSLKTKRKTTHKYVKSRGQVQSFTRRMKMPKRQFIGMHPQLEAEFKRIIEKHLKKVIGG